MNRLSIASTLGFVLLAALLSASTGTAGTSSSGEAFSEERFRALQAEDALVLVDVSASWCPTCAKQESLIRLYLEAHPGVKLHVLRVDYDKQKDWVRYFKAPRQSTLVLYRGDEKVWFSVAETRKRILFEAIDGAAEAG